MIEIPSDEDIQSALDFLISRGGEFAEFFFESRIVHSIFCEDSRVEKVSSGFDTGFGLRIITGDRTAYGYSNILSREELIVVGRSVLEDLERGSGRSVPLRPLEEGTTPGIRIPADRASIEEKVSLVLEADRSARDAGGEISQVLVNYHDSLQTVRIFNSEGDAAGDERRQIVFSVRAVARLNGDIQTAYRSTGGRKGLEYIDKNRIGMLAREAGESAIKIVHAGRSPAGTMTVVLSNQAGGTMIHEAIGHGLEGDAAEKNLSIYSGKIGETVASPLITVIDDATLEGKRGSYHCDDEGVPAGRTVLVDGGKLKSYLLDRRTAAKMGLKSTGNGRRQGFRFRPIVRMSNTMIAPGNHDPREIIASVDKGLFVMRMGGGQVDTSSGDFVFKVNEAYMIEGGKVGEAVRGATLIGNGPAVLKKIDMVGNDLGFDIGTCGKDGQQVPVADAQPTTRIPEITVGGEV